MAGIDRIYRGSHSHLVDFAFDSKVAEVFPDMIRRSVPAYEAVVPLTGLLAARHLAGARLDDSDRPIGAAAPGHREADTTPGHNPAATATACEGLAFDLGCSLGATTLALLREIGDRTCRIVAVDNSAPMLERARTLVTDSRVEFRLQDIRTTNVSGADVVLMNYVLQFVAPGDRQALLDRFREQMTPGGLLLLSEKIRFRESGDQAFFDAAHLAFKKANGYSDLEVSGKRSALENVMVVDSEATHIERLNAAGFAPVRTWFRCLNWASFMAWA